MTPEDGDQISVDEQTVGDATATTTDAPSAAPTKPAQKEKKSRAVAEGIQLHRSGGYVVTVSFRGHRKYKYFPKSCTLDSVKRWRQDMRRLLEFEYGHPDGPLSKRLPELARRYGPSPKGWCYLYVIREGDCVKIGRATDPHRRLEELQTAHRFKLQLVCVVPTHASLEPIVHARFAHLATGREWFLLDPELTHFIELLNRGQNPIALLWADILR